LLVASAASAKGKDKAFTQDRGAVWAASVAVAAELGAIMSAEKDAGVLVYKAGGVMKGRTDVSVSIATEGRGTKVIVNSTHGYHGVFGIGENSRRQQEFLEALTARLANTTASAADASAPAEQATSAASVAATPGGTAAASGSTQGGGVFAIESTPPGAEVYVDGDFVGTTPIAEHSLPMGKHDIELRKKGFAPWKRQLSVSSGTRATVAAEMEPQ
jgi:hypothetical protein